METTKERLERLFNMTNKQEIANEIDIILDDHASTIMVRLEREFVFKDQDGKTLASSCYVSPPNVGHFITIGDKEFEVKKVIHCFKSNSYGTIILEESTIK